MTCPTCTYAPEFGQTPPMECMSVFLTPEALEQHLDRWHPSRRTWQQHQATMRGEHPPAVPGTPVVVLGFTREELDAIEERAWPSSVETWIHEQVTAALERAP